VTRREPVLGEEESRDSKATIYGDLPDVAAGGRSYEGSNPVCLSVSTSRFCRQLQQEEGIKEGKPRLNYDSVLRSILVLFLRLESDDAVENTFEEHIAFRKLPSWP
jgi:hypothetical protein